MKILIDVSPLTSPKSGVGHYVQKISNSLINSPNFDPKFVVNNFFFNDLQKISPLKVNFLFRLINKNIDAKYFLSKKIITNYIKNNKIDIFHQPNFITYELPIKNISTVHDLSWIHYPNFFLKEELKYFEKYFEKSLLFSSKIIVHSNSIKNELCKTFNIKDEKVKVVYEDLRDNFVNLNKKECENFLKTYDLKFKKFFLIINTLEKRKNFEFILDIYEKLSIKIKEEYPLVIFGMPGRFSEEIIERINKVKNCIYFGYLQEKNINQCLSAAKVLFYPSVYEGFGLSPIEAMASGTPTIASSLDVTKEILKDNALLVDLNNYSDWSNNIKLLLENHEIYKVYVEKGISYSKKFKAGTTPIEIQKIYSEIIKN